MDAVLPLASGEAPGTIDRARLAIWGGVRRTREIAAPLQQPTRPSAAKIPAAGGRRRMGVAATVAGPKLTKVTVGMEHIQ
eukprot:2950448-Pyramimonas_sp.AAC.1